MNAFAQNLTSSLTGNIPKAILCVRDLSQARNAGDMKETIEKAADLQKNLLKSTEIALNGLMSDSTLASQTYSSLTGENGVMAGSGYLALEVQYNPNTIYMDSQAGRQVDYSGGAMGSQSTNQMVQVVQPVSTTMSFQLIFDDMNTSDAFMLENISPTIGNGISSVASVLKKTVADGYSIQSQVEGLISLLTMDTTRQVIFFWSKMSFRGELVSVNSRYTMFNKSGNPIRGVVDITIRQGNDQNNKQKYGYDEAYWDQAFTRTFGEAQKDQVSGEQSGLKKVASNLLNLSL